MGGSPLPTGLSLSSLRGKYKVLRNRNFRLLWTSSLIAMMGDFFVFVAMPFLVMNLTEDRAAIGGILAVGGIPRAIFMLFGGVFSDRFSPLPIIKLSRVTFCVMLIAMAALILNERVALWMLYAFSGVMGIIGAFGMPAQMAILPRLVGYDELAPANALTGGTSQLVGAVAPAIVGVAMLYLSTGPLGQILNGIWPAMADLPKRADMQGIGLAYAIDATTVFLSLFALWAIRLGEENGPQMPAYSGAIAAIKDGFHYVWADKSLRAYIIYMALTTFVSMGPQMVGMPVLADDRLDGMKSYGVMMSASAAGAFLGSLFAGIQLPSNRVLGILMMVLAMLRGVGTWLFAYINTTTEAMIIMAVMGVVMGYTMILFMTWIQQRIQMDFMGRVMSLVMLSVMGLQPLSLAFSGWFIDAVGLTPLFVGVGVFTTVTAALALLSKDIRRMGEPPSVGADGALESTGEVVSNPAHR